LLAQGLYHGLRQLCTAGLVAVTDEAAKDVWATLFGIVLQQGLMGFGLLAGGMLTGAGQRRGLLLGTVMGLWNGVLLIAVENLGGKPVTTVAAYGEPLLFSAFGALGGLVGSLIWKPLPTLTVPAAERPRGVTMPDRKKPSPFAGPISWTRVLMGTAVAVGGILWANVILEIVLEATDRKLAVSSHLQAKLVTLEISALAVLFGSCLAGATTFNGLKQGLCVGVLASLVLIGILLGNPKGPKHDLLFTAVEKSTLILVHEMIFATAATCVLALVGGWFGSQLFPPVFKLGRRKDVHAAPAC
jgi:hypothetical protein